MNLEILKIIGFVIFVICVFSFLSLAPWVPTRKQDLERIAKIIESDSKKTFLEVGCGTANVSLFLAKKFPHFEITGIELSPLFFIISWTKAKLSGQKNIKILYGNALKHNFSTYNIIYVFGLPETVQKGIYPKLEKETQKNTQFLSYCFRMNKHQSFQEIAHKQTNQNTIYEYIRK